jgi:hypothetical protein
MQAIQSGLIGGILGLFLGHYGDDNNNNMQQIN